MLHGLEATVRRAPCHVDFEQARGSEIESVTWCVSPAWRDMKRDMTPGRHISVVASIVVLSWTNTRTKTGGALVRVGKRAGAATASLGLGSRRGCIVANSQTAFDFVLCPRYRLLQNARRSGPRRIAGLDHQSGRERPQPLFPSSVLCSVPGSLTSRLRVTMRADLRRDLEHDRGITRTIFTLRSAPSMPWYHARIADENGIGFRH